MTALALPRLHGPHRGIRLTRRLAAIRRVWRKPEALVCFTALPQDKWPETDGIRERKIGDTEDRREAVFLSIALHESASGP